MNSGLDCIIIGGGPAGLTAATYLARFRRNVLLIDSAKSRANLITTSHNLAGFPQGISGKDLLDRMRAHNALYKIKTLQAEVSRIEQAEAKFSVFTGNEIYAAPYILLCTGIVDVEPDMSHLVDALNQGLIRYCPVCDGYEARDKKIAVIGCGQSAINEVKFLLNFSSDVTLIPCMGFEPSATERKMLGDRGIDVVDSPIREIRMENGAQSLIIGLDDGRVLRFDTMYAALGCKPQNSLAQELKLELSDDHRLVTDPHQETSLPGFFGAGDIVSGLNQIGVAVGQAAVAAAAINKRLMR